MAQAGGRALLVGCTTYPDLPMGYQLRGPGNDVALFRSLLIDQFGFGTNQITVLLEGAEERSRPTRANIEREMLRLGDEAREGDIVVVLLAGHGSQQPDVPIDGDGDSEADGLDEIFLPADIRGWDGSKGTVQNAICDDELGRWIGLVRAKGAFVWAVVDACHSGTMLRGASVDRVREVLPGALGIPGDQLVAAREASARTQEAARQEGGMVDGLIRDGGVVALYASQSTEPTVETRLPPEADQPETYGLLTFTINQVLRRSTRPLSYRDLVHAVHEQYGAWGRAYPTPLLEGTATDREVLGAENWGMRGAPRLSRGPGGGLIVDAGALMGVTRGSVFEVFSGVTGHGETEKCLGRLRVLRAMPLESAVEPLAEGDLPDGARCVLAFVDHGDLRLGVSVVADEGRVADSAEAVALVSAMLREMSDAPNSLVRFEADPQRADWLIHVGGGGYRLAPASGLLEKDTGGATSRGVADECVRMGDGRPVDAFRRWLEKNLRAIAKAHNLIALAGAPAAAESSLDIRLEMLRGTGGVGGKWQPVRWDNGREVTEGELVRFRVQNTGTEPMDVTLLFVGADQEIQALIPWGPSGDGGDNRLAPGGSCESPPATVTAAKGREHVVAIAVRAGPQPVDFRWLAQAGIDEMRGAGEATRSLAGAAGSSPLGALLRAAVVGGGTRGISSVKLDRHVMRSLSWRVSGRKGDDIGAGRRADGALEYGVSTKEK